MSTYFLLPRLIVISDIKYQGSWGNVMLQTSVVKDDKMCSQWVVGVARCSAAAAV